MSTTKTASLPNVYSPTGLRRAHALLREALRPHLAIDAPDFDVLPGWQAMSAAQRTSIRWVARQFALGIKPGRRADDACLHFFVGAAGVCPGLALKVFMLIATRGAAEVANIAMHALRDAGVIVVTDAAK